MDQSIQSDPSRYCRKCGEAWITHNDDGSCVEPPPEHTQDCMAAEIQSMIRQAYWQRDFPNYCRRCMARGYVRREKPLPITDNWFRANCADCPDCLGQNKCPRCGALLVPQADRRPNEDVSCMECDWHHGKVAGDGMPVNAPCLCHAKA